MTVALAVVAPPRSASGWSPAGHMALGAVAYEELARIDPAAAEAVLALLASHPHHGDLIDGPADRALSAEQRRAAIFMRAARWADDVRRPPYDEFSNSSWHYVNFRYRPPSDLTPPRSPEADGFLLWALSENVRRLGSESDTVRAVALTWLFHLVTDIHQPLHNIALVDAAHPRGDRGGNLSFIRIREDQPTGNLHWFWDGLLLRGEEPTDALARARELARHDGGSAEAAVEEIDPTDPDLFHRWSAEGARIAVEQAYLGGTLRTGTEEAGVALPPGYAEQAAATARARGVLGARRLARLLSILF